MSRPSEAAIYKAAKVHAACRGLDFSAEGAQQAIVPDEFRWMRAALAAAHDPTNFEDPFDMSVRLGDVVDTLRAYRSDDALPGTAYARGCADFLLRAFVGGLR